MFSKQSKKLRCRKIFGFQWNNGLFRIYSCKRLNCCSRRIGKKTYLVEELHCCDPGSTNMLADSSLFWWSGMQKFIEHKCNACMSACKNSNYQSTSTKNINQAEMTVPVEETGINTSGYLLDGNITSEPYVFFGIDRSSEWLVFRLCIFTETMDVITFFWQFS